VCIYYYASDAVCSRYVFDVVWGEGASSLLLLLLYVLGGPLNVNYTSFPCPHICFTTLKQTFMIRLNDVSGTSRKIMFIIYYFARGVSTSKTRKKTNIKSETVFFLFSSFVAPCVCVCVIKRCLFFGAKKELLTILFLKHLIYIYIQSYL
jgi:hypothetical protein